MRTETVAAIANADGLTQEERDLTLRLLSVYYDNLARNKVLSDYYNDKNKVKNLGFTVPNSLIGKVNTSVGWCGKAVDMLAERSILDSFTMVDPTDEEQAMLESIVKQNRLTLRYRKSLPCLLTHTCGFWEVVRKNRRASIHFRNAMTGSATWDYENERIEAAMMVEATRPASTIDDETVPTHITVHTSTHVITFKEIGRKWYATRERHTLGRPMVEPMVFHATDLHPFGTRSRVSKTMMGITDEMQRELLRTAMQSEIYSTPTKVLSGIAEDQFDSVTENKFKTYMDALVVMTKDEDGDTPELKVLQPTSMEPHFVAQEKLACRAASDSYLPVSAFGIQSSVYATAESQRASNDSLILEAETLNDANGDVLAEVMRMAFAVSRGVSMDELTDAERSVMVHWRNPAFPSGAAAADEAVKIASVVPGYAETSLCQEQLGWDEDMRTRYKAERRRAEAISTRDAILAVNE